MTQKYREFFKMSAKNRPLNGRCLSLFRSVGCGSWSQADTASTRDLLGPSTILTKLSHTHGYINWPLLVKKYAKQFKPYVLYTKKTRILSFASILQRNWNVKAVFPTHNAVHFTRLLPSPPVRGMFAREQYYDGNMVFFARCITEAHGTGSCTHPCVCKIH